MITVIQRVDSAAVYTDGILTGSIERGILVFLGVGKGDTRIDADYLLDKILHLRIFEDENGKMNGSLRDQKGGMLVVSQFTLLGDCRKGRRPSFTRAEEPAPARELYEYFLTRARREIDVVAEGSFQQMMKVELVNDGPVTMIINSRKED